MRAQSIEKYKPLSAERQAELRAYRLASFRSRAGAIIVDGVVVFCAVGLLSMSTEVREFLQSKELVLSLDFGGLISVAVFIAYFSLTSFLWDGRTLGKRLFHIRVVPVGQDRMSLARSVQRALAYSVSAAVVGLGFFQYFRHPNRQTVHDQIAETIVVHEVFGPQR